MLHRTHWLIACSLSVASWGCASEHSPSEVDAGMALRHETGPFLVDAGPARADAGPGSPGSDAGPGRLDAATARDSGPTVARDAGPPRIRDDAGPGAPGASCSDVAECMGDGAMCLMSLGGFFEFPGGYCTRTCTMPSDCGSGGTCVAPPTMIGAGGGSMAFCARTCETNADCREAEGYECTSIPFGTAGSYCIPSLMIPGFP